MQPKLSHTAPSGWRGSFKKDFLASVVVFLVALPLCMGIAIASGAPVAAGLITGIVGGLVVGFLAGSPLQVSGPAAGLTVLVYDAVQTHGLPFLGIIVLFAGAIQVVAGLLKMGQWFRAVSPAVIQGMLAGIGVLIFASQFHVMVDDAPRGSGLKNLVSIPEAVRKGLPLPEWHDREEREFRTEKLKEIGSLHEHQQTLQERIAEHVSLQASEPESPVQAELLSQYALQQERITAELEVLAADLENGRLSAGSRKSARVHQRVALALTASRGALDDLKELRVAEARESQAAAVQSLEHLSAGLKNHDWAAKLGLLTILAIVLWQAFVPKKLKFIPPPLVAVLIATLFAATLAVPVLYVEVPDSLFDGVHLPTLTVLQDAPLWALLQAGLVIAVVASAETLLCATAVDQMHHGARTKYDRELWAQGVGNMICGCLGALPMTGVIVRSSANVQAGGQTRVSAILHGLWLLVFVVGLGFLLRMIPTAALAGILVYTGYKLMNFKAIKDLRKYGWGEVVIYAATVVTIVSLDLLTGVIVGIALSGLKLLLTFSKLKTSLDLNPDREIGGMELHLEGAATFLSLPLLAAELERVPRGERLRVHFQRLSYIDHACLNLLTNWASQHGATGGSVVVDWRSLEARMVPDSPEPARGETKHAAVTPEDVEETPERHVREAALQR